MLAASSLSASPESEILAGSFAWMSVHKPRRATFRSHDAGSNSGRHPSQRCVASTSRGR